MNIPLPVLLILASCGEPDSPPPAPAPPPATPAVAQGPSLLLVTMDTTRADRIGAYGHTQASTPNIDRVAAGGVRFERAYTTVPLTTPAHASILSGLYPTRHGVHTNGDAILSDSATTLAELLQERGYHTAASVSAFVTTRIWNLDQGFDEYFDSVEAGPEKRDQRWSRERRAGQVVDDLEKWLAAKPAAEPFFAWAHFYDPHEPYDPPEPWKQTFASRPYDGEIAYMDEQIGRLRGLAEKAAGGAGLAIVLVGDHGEGLGEHGETLHGMYIFDATAHVPYIVLPPGALASARVVSDTAVSNVDVTPTALGLLGIAVPADLDGHDLSGFTRGESPSRPPVYIESESPFNRFGFHPEWAAAEGGWKYFATPAPRLLNPVQDRSEQQDFRPEQPELSRRLSDAVSAVQARRVDSQGYSASPEVIEQLAALGYVAGIEPGSRDWSNAPDVKDKSEFIRRVDAARRSARDPRRAGEAEAALRKVLKEAPHMGETRVVLARVLLGQGKLKQAEAVLAEGVEQQPQSTVLRSNLAGVLYRQQRVSEAFDLVRSIYEQVPGDDLARYSMLRYLLTLERVQEALTMGEQWLEKEPTNRGLQALVGEALVVAGQPERGEPLLLSSLEDFVPRANVNRTLGLLAAKRGEIPAATTYLETEASWFPQNAQVRVDLGELLLQQQLWDDAAAEFEAATTRMPDNPTPRRLWAMAVFNTRDYGAAAAILAPALERFPDDPDVLLMHANILAATDRVPESRQVFEEAKALREAKRAAMEAAKGMPVIEEPRTDIIMPGRDGR